MIPNRQFSEFVSFTNMKSIDSRITQLQKQLEEETVFIRKEEEERMNVALKDRTLI